MSDAALLARILQRAADFGGSPHHAAAGAPAVAAVAQRHVLGIASDFLADRAAMALAGVDHREFLGMVAQRLETD